jgi:hypothetical protein
MHALVIVALITLSICPALRLTLEVGGQRALSSPVRTGRHGRFTHTIPAHIRSCAAELVTAPLARE